MRYAGFSILILLFVANAADVTFILKNYDNYAELKIFNASGVVFEGKVGSGDILKLNPGFYRFELSALNKTFVKEVNVSSDQVLEFNLGFTNSTEFLEITIHSIVFQGGYVEEVILISNNGDLNFDGNLAISLPEISNIQILSSSLDFLESFVSGDKLIFESLLIAEKSNGTIRIAYTLKDNTMKRELRNERVILIPLVEIEDFKNLEKEYMEIGGQKVIVYQGNGSFWVKFKFSSFPFAYVAIFLASSAVFLVFFTNRGGWDEKDRRS
jgi:hypothetical protein